MASGKCALRRLYRASFSSTSIPAGTTKEVASLTIPYGLYVLTASVQFMNHFNELTNLSFLGTDVTSIVRSTGNAGGGMCISTVQWFGNSSNTIKLMVYQGNSSAQSINQNRFTALRIA